MAKDKALKTDIREELRKYGASMEKMYYVFLAINLGYEMLGRTTILYNLTLLAINAMAGMEPELAGLLFRSFLNLRFLIIIPAVYTIIMDTKTRRERILLTGMLLLGWLYFFLFREWNDTVMFRALLLIVASYGKDFKKIAKYSICIVGGGMLLTALLSIMGILPEYNMVRNGKVRHSFGTYGATTVSGLFTFVFLTIMFLRNGELKWYEYVLIGLMTLLNILFVDGRVALLCTCLAMGSCALVSCVRKKRWGWTERAGRVFRHILLLAYILIAAVYMLMMLSYRPDENAFYHKISFLSTFEGRFAVPNGMLDELPPSLFGNYFDKYDAIALSPEDIMIEEDEAYTFLDSSYAALYLIYGIVGLLTALAVLTGVLYPLYREKQVFRMFLMAIAGLFFVVQRGIMDPAYNIFMLMLFANIPPSFPIEKRKRRS